MISCPRLTVSGLGGDSGKTVVSVGLCRFWHGKGLGVAPFKKGPDYIDMEWLRRGAFHACYNIDLFLMSREQVLSSFCVNSRNADIAVIEGNRGLYDGMDVEGNVSTAEIAKLLKSPVILVVDCTKVTRTVAALVKGCQGFHGLDRSVSRALCDAFSQPRTSSLSGRLAGTWRSPSLAVCTDTSGPTSLSITIQFVSSWSIEACRCRALGPITSVSSGRGSVI